MMVHHDEYDEDTMSYAEWYNAHLDDLEVCFLPSNFNVILSIRMYFLEYRTKRRTILSGQQVHQAQVPKTPPKPINQSINQSLFV